MKSIANIAFWLFKIWSFLIIILSLNANLAFGSGLGDLYYLFLLAVLIILISVGKYIRGYNYGNKPSLESATRYPKYANGLYDIQGNVAEMTADPGVAMEGSYLHTALESYSNSVLHYSKPEKWLGFCYVAIQNIDHAF